MKKINKKQKFIILISLITIIIIIGAVICLNVIKTNIANGKYYSSNSDSNNGNLLPEYIKKGITLGGVTGTLESLDTSDATATPEDILYGKTAYVNGEKITGTYLTLGMLQIGDYVAYIPDSASNYEVNGAYNGNSTNQIIYQDKLNWRILSINDNGTVNLISETPTSVGLYLGGARGYNNGVFLLNDIAKKLYSNSKLGATARSLTIEDIENGMTEEGLNFVHSYTNSDSGLTWGQAKTYTNPIYKYYPNLYSQENGAGINTEITITDGVNQSDSFYNSPTAEDSSYANTSLKVTQTYYVRTMNDSYYQNSAFYNLIHNAGEEYWVASRCAHAYLEDVYWGLRYVCAERLDGNYLFHSDSQTDSSNFSIRVVVSLDANIKIISGDGKTADTSYQI